MAGDKRYVYGVIDAEPMDLELTGLEDAPVYTVDHRKHAAIVSDIDTMDPEDSEENVTAHDEVLRAVMTHDGGRPVVPMQFGMVFENDRALKHVLRGGRQAFTRALRSLEGTVELGVKAVATGDDVVDEQRVREAVGSTLDPLSQQVSEGDQFSDRLVVNRSYLVDRDDREAFDEAIEELRETLDGVTVQYTGPWAPYNFVDIEIGVAQ